MTQTRAGFMVASFVEMLHFWAQGQPVPGSIYCTYSTPISDTPTIDRSRILFWTALLNTTLTMVSLEPVNALRYHASYPFTVTSERITPHLRSHCSA